MEVRSHDAHVVCVGRGTMLSSSLFQQVKEGEREREN